MSLPSGASPWNSIGGAGRRSKHNIPTRKQISAKENDYKDKAHIRMTNLNWKFRYYNHLQSSRNPTLRNKIVLSRNYWDLMELGLLHVLNWKIIERSSSTNSLHGVGYHLPFQHNELGHLTYMAVALILDETSLRSVYVYESEEPFPIVEVYPYSITNPIFLLLTVSLL